MNPMVRVYSLPPAFGPDSSSSKNWTEPAWEYYSDVAWNPWAVDEIEGESDGGGKAASGDGEGEDEATIPRNEGTTQSQIPKDG
jgi:hypothetical protein